MPVKASHRGITLDPLHPNISQLVTKYESVWGNGRSTEIIKETHARTPFISVSSNAVVGGYNASMSQLQGDWQAHSTLDKLANKRTGVAPAGDTYKKYMYYGGKHRYLPKAGISELEIDSKGGLGSIRYGKIKLKAYQKSDLEHIEKYYMVPGIRLLIQWGWSTFGGDLIDLWDKKYLHGSGEIDIQQDIIKKVLGVNSLNESVVEEGSDALTPGRYDAMIGLVTKFDWSLDDGGAYDITIEVTSTNGLMLSTPMDSNQLGAALITTKETYEDNYSWPFGDGDKTYDEIESNRPIGDIEAILFSMEDSSGKGTWTGEGGDDGWSDFDGSSVTRNTILQIKNRYIQKNSPYSYGPPRASWLNAKKKDNDGDLKRNINYFRPIITKKLQGASTWDDITGEDRSIIRGPVRSVEHADSWKGQEYGMQAPISDTDAGNITQLIEAPKVETFVSYRFIEDVLINFIGIPKNGEGLPVVGLSSTHEEFANEGYEWSDYTNSLKALTPGYSKKRYKSNVILNHPHLRSTNPNVCILPGQQGIPCSHEEMETLIDEMCDGRENDWFNAAPFMFWALSNGDGLAAGTDGYSLSDPNGYSWSKNRIAQDTFDTFSANSECNEGYIRNIMFNTKFVAETYRNNPTMDAFIKALLDGANNVCGNVWDFSIKANPNDNGLIQVTDSNHAPGLKSIIKEKLKVYELKANSAQTILTNVQLTSKLPDAVKNAAMCAMTATEPDNTTNEDSILFKMYGIGVEDRFTRQARREWKSGPGLTVLEEKKKYEDAVKVVDKLEEKGWMHFEGDDSKNYYAALAITGGASTMPADLKYKQWCYSYWYSVATGNQTDCRTANTNLKEYISHEMNFGYKQGSTSTLMPVELSFDIEGISGFYMGNAITCAPISDGGILPDRYQGSALFQVSKVNHKIGRESWKTSITNMMRMTNAQVPIRSGALIKTNVKAAKKATKTPVGDYNPPATTGKAEEYLNYDAFEATYKKKGYEFKTNGEVNSGAIRVNNFNRHGTTGSRKDGMGFIDWFCHAYIEDGKKVFEAHTCTTLPGSSVLTRVNKGHSSGGWAILKPGMYHSHIYDWHSRDMKKNPPKPGHLAGSQRAGSVTVYRDATKDNKHDLNSTTLVTGYFGINLHRSAASGKASRVGNYSHGCQVFLNNSDFLRWTAAVSSKNPKHAKKKKASIPFALFDEGDMELKK